MRANFASHSFFSMSLLHRVAGGISGIVTEVADQFEIQAQVLGRESIKLALDLMVSGN